MPREAASLLTKLTNVPVRTLLFLQKKRNKRFSGKRLVCGDSSIGGGSVFLDRKTTEEGLVLLGSGCQQILQGRHQPFGHRLLQVVHGHVHR